MLQSPPATLAQWSIVAQWIATVLGASVMLSLLAPYCEKLFSEARQGLAQARGAVTGRGSKWWKDSWRNFWASRSADRRRPVVAEIRRLADAVESIGLEQVKTLERVEAKLKSHGVSLRSLEIAPATGDQGRRADPRAARSSVFGIFATLLTALAIGGLNAFLLSVFFEETIGSYRLLPYPLPDLQIAQVLAVLFFLFEFVAGWAIYTSNLDHDSATHRGNGSQFSRRFFQAGPWLALASLGLIELVAYSVLSARMDIPTRLGILASSAFYGISKYFFGLLGAAMTVILAYLGHQVAMQWDRWHEARGEREARRAHERAGSRSANDAAQLQLAWQAACDLSRAFPATLAADLAAAAGTVRTDATLERTIAGAIRRAERAAVADDSGGTPSSESTPSLPVRTPVQALADILINVFLLAVLFLLAYLMIGQIAAYALSQGIWFPRPVLYAAATGVVGAMAVLSLLLRESWRGLRFSSTELPGDGRRSTRRALRVVLLGLLCLAVAAIGWLAIIARPFGNSVAINGLLGLFLASAIVTLSMSLDAALIGGWHLLNVAGLAAIGVGILGTIVVVGGVELFLGLLGFVVRGLCIPGVWLRSLIASRASS